MHRDIFFIEADNNTGDLPAVIVDETHNVTQLKLSHVLLSALLLQYPKPLHNTLIQCEEFTFAQRVDQFLNSARILRGFAVIFRIAGHVI